jgi:hypothetical protein
MDDVIKELQTGKFWILALIGIAFGIVGNLLTDLLKFYARSSDFKSSIGSLRSEHSRSLIMLLGPCLLISLQSLYLFTTDVYWSPRLLACFFALHNALVTHRFWSKHLASDFPNRHGAIRTETFFAFFSLWIALFGVSRFIYWTFEFGYVSFPQANILLIVIFVSYWVFGSISHAKTMDKK